MKHSVAKSSTSPTGEPPRVLVRLQKFLAAAGIGSRRHCEEYILSRRVSVDGEEIRDLGTRVDPRRQTVRLDGQIIKSQPKRYYLLNKPVGYLCTNRDPAGRPQAIDLLGQDGPRLFTVGRLDENSQGLLLVTNDGELANRLAHPRYRVQRKYRVQVVGKPTRQTLDTMQRGVYFSEGKFRVKHIKRIRSQRNSTFLEIILSEGQNREIRRVLARLGHKVISLQRIGFGTLKLGRLGEGEFRPLKPTELKELRDMVRQSAEGGKQKAESRRRKVRGRKRKTEGRV